jgi:hypothetical protein
MDDWVLGRGLGHRDVVEERLDGIRQPLPCVGVLGPHFDFELVSRG